MRLFLLIIGIFTTSVINLLAAEAGMPQLDPTYWASQAFWLILIFTILYISIAKFYLPKIKNNLDDRVEIDINNPEFELNDENLDQILKTHVPENLRLDISNIFN